MKVGKLKSRCSCGCKEVENWSLIRSDLNSRGCRGKMVICRPFDALMWGRLVKFGKFKMMMVWSTFIVFATRMSIENA